MAIIGGGVVGTDRRAVPVRSEVEDGTHVARLAACGKLSGRRRGSAGLRTAQRAIPT